MAGAPDEPHPNAQGAPGPKTWAAGIPSVVHSLDHGLEQMGRVRTARTLLELNQHRGFDCPSCPSPDPDPEARHTAEFCESGAKAVAWEATTHTVDRSFFARDPIAALHGQSEWWLGQQGRLTEPMHKRVGGTIAASTPDTPVVHKGLNACDLTVQISTKLNRSHTVTGREALILPCLGGTDRDRTGHGEQAVTVENSQGQVHVAHRSNTPVAKSLIVRFERA